MVGLPPDVVRWISRSGEDPDCAITGIALATGCSYEHVLAAAIAVVGERAHHEGMFWPDIQRVVKHLGFTYKMRRKYDLSEDTGLLDCIQPGARHIVYLWEGRIIEPHQDKRSLWLNADDFLKQDGWTAGMLLTLKKD